MILKKTERMAIYGGVIAMLLESSKLKSFDEDRERDANVLLRVFEREDGTLNAIEVRRKLQESNRYIAGFGRVQASVRSILEDRHSDAPGAEKLHLLPAIIDGVAAEARAAGLPEAHVEWARLAAYCSAIVFGPDFYRLPTNAPAGIMRPLGYVPSVAELRPSNEER